jgi:nucleoside-diphosphate-sugar epimerase
MARILIIGCGGRGQALARELVAAGHAVRGTTRDPARFDAIRAAGAEPYEGDPDRIATLMGALEQTAIVAWLMGSATGDQEKVRELHVGRLRMLTEKVVDTSVRGLVYEAAGTVDPGWLEEGELTVRAARATWNIPLQVLRTPPSDCAAWTRDAATAVERLLHGG